MSKELKIELVKDNLENFKKVYCDYNNLITLYTDNYEKLFDDVQMIINKRDQDSYESVTHDMWYYLWVTSKKTISDSDKNSILDYLEMIFEVYEENQYTSEDYDEDEDMTWEDKYEYDVNQRKQEYKRIVDLISKL